MTNNNHPITPPLELLKYWEDQHFDEGENYDVMLIQAYQAGADQELEACCEWINRERGTGWGQGTELRTTTARTGTTEAGNPGHARRPKPPSLKEQALETIAEMADCMKAGLVPKRSDLDTLRRALESLPD